MKIININNNGSKHMLFNEVALDPIEVPDDLFKTETEGEWLRWAPKYSKEVPIGNSKTWVRVGRSDYEVKEAIIVP